MRHSFFAGVAYVSCVVAVSVTNAHASGKYDRKIEQAAVEIAVQKLGQMRGSHEIHEPHYLHPPLEARNAENGMLKPANQANYPLFTVRVRDNN